MQRERVRGLYAVTPDRLERADLLGRCERALAGGASMLQLRDKASSPSERRARAQALAARCRAYRALFIINDDPALALRVGADGVHLGRDDGAIAQARALLGPDALIGASCYDDLALAERAAQAGADYLAFGSVFASEVKPAAVRADLALFAQAKRLRLPLVAIGGITIDRAASVRDAGAAAVAVITDLFDAPDITQRAARYAHLFAVEESR